MKKTLFTTNTSHIWYLIDCKNQSLGRLSTSITHILLKKNINTYSPSNKQKNYIVLINSKQLKHNKKKIYYFCYKPGHPGKSLKKKFFSSNTIKQTIKKMLPINVRNKLIKQLKIYENEKHPHKGQININVKSKFF
uniref:Ribosomal protein L13 n=1 Tax=Nitzschia sp. NIES-3576 TaxID=2083273 RepID=A0A2Z5ZAI5_9STRA|nr:ribosomal protein L13 [Nitzschia sp. NIES-3576]